MLAGMVSAPPEVKLVSPANVPTLRPEPGLERKILARTDRLMLVEHRMSAGYQGAVHQHPHEQLVLVQSGRLRVQAGGRTFEVAAGESFVVPGGSEHGATALVDSVVLDVFTPARDDYAS